MKKEIMNAPVAEDVTEVKKATLTKAGKAAAKKPSTRKPSVTKIGESVIIKVEDAKKAEAKKAAAKVKKAPSRKKQESTCGNPADYKTMIKDGIAIAVKKSDLEKSKKEAPVLPAISEDDKKRYSYLVDFFKKSWDISQKTELQSAFALYEIYTRGLYRVDGYKNLLEFSEAMFGLGRSQTYDLIGIVERFGVRIENGSPTNAIVDKYSDFSKSQLGAMVGHTDDELESITSDMSVRDIKAALKKSKVEDEKEEVRDEKGKSGADDQTPSGEPRFSANLIHEFAKVEEWDAIRDPDDELVFSQLCATIRHCLSQGHIVRIMDCFTATN